MCLPLLEHVGLCPVGRRGREAVAARSTGTDRDLGAARVDVAPERDVRRPVLEQDALEHRPDVRSTGLGFASLVIVQTIAVAAANRARRRKSRSRCDDGGAPLVDAADRRSCSRPSDVPGAPDSLTVWRPASRAIVPVVSLSPTASAPPATWPSIFRLNRPRSSAGTRRFTIVIEPLGSACESSEAVDAVPRQRPCERASAEFDLEGVLDAPRGEAPSAGRGSRGGGENDVRRRAAARRWSGWGCRSRSGRGSPSPLSSTHSRIGVSGCGVGGIGGSQLFW